MKQEIEIGGRRIAQDAPVFFIAELSCNHLQDFDRAVRIIRAAKEAGADAVKLQTYTPDTLTIDSDKEWFRIEQGTIWDGTTFYRLYEDAYTPWEWQPGLMRTAREEGLVCFSSPFDPTAVDFLEGLNVPAFKIASFEITDLPLIRRAARTGKPILISTGIAYEEDIRLALDACLETGNDQVILLKCASAYPAPCEDINLRLIPDMRERFHVLTGFSDHTTGETMAVAAAAMGAVVIEKHLTLSRNDGGPDAAFSMEPEEFKRMVDAVRNTESALGSGKYDLSEMQKNSRLHSRSLFVTEHIRKGEAFTENNIRSIRPGYGLSPRYYEEVLGKKANRDLEKGTPLAWDMVESGKPIG